MDLEKRENRIYLAVFFAGGSFISAVACLGWSLMLGGLGHAPQDRIDQSVMANAGGILILSFFGLLALSLALTFRKPRVKPRILYVFVYSVLGALACPVPVFFAVSLVSMLIGYARQQ